MFGVLQQDEQAVGLVPEAGVDVGVEHLDVFARLLQGLRSATVGPAAQEAGAGQGALVSARGAGYMLEAPADERVRVEDRHRAGADPLEEAQADEQVDLRGEFPGEGGVVALPGVVQEVADGRPGEVVEGQRLGGRLVERRDQGEDVARRGG